MQQWALVVYNIFLDVGCRKIQRWHCRSCSRPQNKGSIWQTWPPKNSLKWQQGTLKLMRSLQNHWIFSMSQQVLKAPRPMLQLKRQFKLQIGYAQNPERTTKTSEIPTIQEWPREQIASKESGMPMMPEVSVQQRYQIFVVLKPQNYMLERISGYRSSRNACLPGPDHIKP